jgi:hypothetical protein
MQPDAQCQAIHLQPGVVDVVFTCHAVATGRENVGHGGSKGSTTAMAHVQGACGIGRDELYQDGHSLTQVGYLRAMVQQLSQRFCKDVVLEKEIHETRPSGLGTLDIGMNGQALGQGGGQLSRWHAQAAPQDQADIGGKIPVARLGAAFEFNGRPRRISWQQASFPELVQRLGDQASCMRLDCQGGYASSGVKDKAALLMQ